MQAHLSTSRGSLVRLLSAGALLASLLTATPALATDDVEELTPAVALEQTVVEESEGQTVATDVTSEEEATTVAEGTSEEAAVEETENATQTSEEETVADTELSSEETTETGEDAADAQDAAIENATSTEETTAEETNAALEPAASIGSTPSGAVSVSEGTYILQSDITANRVVDASGVNPQAGANVATWEYNGGTNQQWIVRKDTDSNWYYLYLKSANSGLALGTQGSGANVNAYLASTSGVSDLKQILWSFVGMGDGSYHLVNAAHSDMCLDVANNSTDLAANLCLWFSGDASKANQRFYLINSKPNVAAGTKGLEGAYTVQLQSGSTALVADIEGGTTQNGGNMVVWAPNGQDNQTIYLEEDTQDPGFYTAWIVGTGKVLDVDHGLPFVGTNILQWEKNGGNNQKWSVSVGSYVNGVPTNVTLTNKATGLVLGSQGTTIYSNIAGLAKGSANTSFQLNPTVLIHEGINIITPLINSNVVLDVDHASTGTASLLLWGNTGTINQRFEMVSAGTNLWRIRTASSGGWITWSNGMTVQQTGSGSDAATSANTWKAIFKNGGISLINQASNLAFDMYGGSTNWGTKIITWESHGGNAQHFRFIPADLINSGIYFIQSYHNANYDQSRVLDVYGGSKNVDANVQAYPFNGGTAQKFAIEKSFGAYTIRNINSGLYVSVQKASKEHGANVLQDMSAQLWKPEIADGGYIRFINTNSGMSLEAASGNTANVVQFNKGQASLSERWKLVSTTASGYQLQGDSSGVPAAARTGKKVLFVGNSFTFYNDLQQMVSYLTGAETCAITIPGAYLGWPVQMEAVQNALNSGDYDYLVIQEQSSYAIDNYGDYLYNLRQYISMANNAGAQPIIYGTWAYPANTYGITSSNMFNKLKAAFNNASAATGVPVADVTQGFANEGHSLTLYVGDNKHPSIRGTAIAARIISALINSLG